MGSRRDVANRRQHRSGCASPPTTTSSSVSLSCTLSAPVSPSVPLLLFARRGIARSRSLRRVAIRLSRSVALPLARSRGPSVSLPLDRRSLSRPCRTSGFLAASFSLSLAFGALRQHTVCVSSYALAPLFSFPRCVPRALTGREIRSNRANVPSTPWCAARSAPEGGRREIQWRGSFLHERENCDGGASSLSLLLTVKRSSVSFPFPVPLSFSLAPQQ